MNSTAAITAALGLAAMPGRGFAEATYDPLPAPLSWRVAQAPVSLEERVRTAAGRMGAYRRLLNDPDANVRLAALDEMLQSTDASVRELAFEAGFASADATLRALALRGRLLATKTLVFELVNSKSLSAEAWAVFAKQFGGEKLVFNALVVNPANNELSFSGGVGRLAGQELNLAYGNGAIRVRLAEGPTMLGQVTYYGITTAVRLVLQ